MEWSLDKKRPICPQLCERLCIMIASGVLNAGERVMSVREVAVQAGVTPNTVQKSFEQLEQQGVIYSIRGSGWYVSDDTHIARDVLSRLVHTKTQAYLSDMRSLGIQEETIIRMIKEEFRHE
jgi:DNA-binding transcriptional regulator YhcF (GntR family)